MSKFSVNFEALDEKLKTKHPVYRYADVKHRLRKVAFDIVRFVETDNIDGLWQIQKSDDGEVIVAMYSDDPNMLTEKTASSSNWGAVADSYGNINLFYKNRPVTKMSLAKLGLSNEAPEDVCRVLQEKLATNIKLLNGLLASLSSEERNDLLSAHPELTKIMGVRK